MINAINANQHKTKLSKEKTMIGKKLFSPRSISSEEEYVDNAQKLEGKVAKEVDEWILDQSDEHSLVIYGDKGDGADDVIFKQIYAI